MSEKPKTICVRCKHHCGARATDPWHSHKCLHPELERTKEIDPVTGCATYVERDTLNKIVVTGRRHPFCRDVNRGNCTHYEPRIFGRIARYFTIDEMASTKEAKP